MKKKIVFEEVDSCMHLGRWVNNRVVEECEEERCLDERNECVGGIKEYENQTSNLYEIESSNLQ